MEPNEKEYVLLGCVVALVILMLFFEGLYMSTKHMLDGMIIEENRRIEQVRQKSTELVDAEAVTALRIKARIMQLQPRLDLLLVDKITFAILRESKCFNLSPSLVLHLIYEETIPKFSPMSTSKIGAIGLMQVRYEIHCKEIPALNSLRQEHLYRIDENVHFGCMILRKYLDMSDDLTEALHRYVGGKDGEYVRAIYKGMAEYEVM